VKGRKPLPSGVIRLLGDSKHTHRPPRTGEPKPPAVVPKCPKHLSKLVKKIWKDVAREVSSLNYITKLDIAVYSRYCEGRARLIMLNEELDTILNPELESNNLTVRAEQYRLDYKMWNQAKVETAKGLFKLEKKNGKETGKIIENPFLGILWRSHAQMAITKNKINAEIDKIWGQMRRDEVELGFTPSSRPRIKVAGGQPEKGNEKERFFS